MMIVKKFYFLFLLIPFNKIIAQSISKGGQEIPVTSAVPFLRIPVDARSAGMADIGVATSPDNNSDYHNPAKFAFIENDYGFSVNYSPWLRQLVDDIHLISAGGYYKINSMQTIATSLRYFSLGKIDFTDASGNGIGSYNPNELAFDFHYARKMSKKFGMGISLRYIYSNLTGGIQQAGSGGGGSKAGHAAAGDISMFYTTPVKLKSMKSRINWGLNLSNIGNKMTYTSASVGDYLPANFGTGVSYELDVDKYNSVNFNFEINKLMVPTPDTTTGNDDPLVPDYKEKATISSIFGSWGDAPGGLSEELKEYILQVGVEYWYNKQFAVRTGYFYETDAKGGRNFLTAGLGIKYNAFALNFSYLVPISATRNPLDNTMRVSLVFNFNKEKSEKPAMETSPKATESEPKTGETIFKTDPIKASPLPTEDKTVTPSEEKAPEPKADEPK